MKQFINKILMSLFFAFSGIIANSEMLETEASSAVVEADSVVTLAVLIDGCAGDLVAFESSLDLVKHNISADVSKDEVKASYETLCKASQKTVDNVFFDSAFLKFTEKKAVSNTSAVEAQVSKE